MTISICTKNYSFVELTQYINHFKKEIMFFVRLSIRPDGDITTPGIYKEFAFKSFKAAYNKYDKLIDKYNLAK